LKQGEEKKKVILKYDAEEKEVARLLKTFIGEVHSPGTTYNIQNAFHSQGYFGVKITPLGSHLALLEGQEEGEVEALMEDAKGWLDQWFSAIRPWKPQDVDLERIIWLRIFGIPVHAWNDDFFAQLTKPWGSFMHADNTTSKKITLDVARILIRTSCQIVIDEFVDVQVNGEIFHLRVLEDSYGPMRVMVEQEKIQNGRTLSRSSSEADDEEVRMEMEVEEEPERESEGEGDNLLAINTEVMANNVVLNCDDRAACLLNDKERMEENSNQSINKWPLPLLENLNSTRGGTNLEEGGAIQEDLLNVVSDNLLGQEVGSGGPANFIPPQAAVKGGVFRRISHSEDVGRASKSFVKSDMGQARKGGVYSDGPRSVYNKLVSGPCLNEFVCQTSAKKKQKHTNNSSHVLPSASLRKQHQLAKSLNSRKSLSVSSTSVARVQSLEVEGGTAVEVCPQKGGVRKSNMGDSGQATAGSFGMAGNSLCDSSINSSNIRNCNRIFLQNYEQEVASKVWRGALVLGVEENPKLGESSSAAERGNGTVVDCINEIQVNEKRDEEECIKRERKKFVHQ
jgi:hypothetical protein